MQRRLSRRKRLAFTAIALLLSYAFLEICSGLILTFFHGGVGITLTKRHNVTANEEMLAGRRDQPDILHPYIGFVRQPEILDDESAEHQQLYVTEFGFHDTAPPLRKRVGNELIVGILGGSVAEQIAIFASDALEAELKKAPQFADREIVFVRLALAGHKQPQQLMTVGYLLTLGAQFDILISIDGFNEVALPIVENVPNDVFPSYPRSWHAKIVDATNPMLLRLVGHMTHVRFQQQASARFFESPPLCYSLTAALIWKISHESRNRAILKDMHRISTLSRSKVAYGATGPLFRYTDDKELNEHCVDVWSRSTEFLHQLCAANGIRFYEFLQPNQYLEGSKPMSEQERMFALNPEQPYQHPVVDCYPLMVEEAQSLRARGVPAHDLTQLFAEHPEAVYIDDCCHFNQDGCSLIAQAIGSAIRDDFDQGPQAQPQRDAETR